ERVHVDLHHRRFPGRQSPLEGGAYIFGFFNGDTEPAARFGVLREVYLVKLAAVFGIAEKDDLFPLDLPERVVLYYHDEDRKIVFHGGREFAHQHRERPVADERDRFSLRKRDLRRDRVW